MASKELVIEFLEGGIFRIVKSLFEYSFHVLVLLTQFQ